MQSSSSNRVFNPTLTGASPATDAIPRKLIPDSYELIEETTGRGMLSGPPINYQLSTINQSRSQGVISSARRSAKAEVRGASPRESTIFNGDHDVTAASRPVKAFVPV